MGLFSNPAVPVLMLHSVAPSGALAPQAWAERLATAPDLLEASFEAWRRRGWRTLHLGELGSILQGRRPVPRQALVVTLDDGYADNWIALHPLLRAYDFRATVFVSTDFVDPRPIVRMQRRDSESDGRLEWKGYLSWDEMRAMEADGTIEIGSHARTHTWYFVSDRIVDYYRPAIGLTSRDSLHRFLWLNDETTAKPRMLTEMTDRSVPWGTPIYDFQPALVARRFFPLPEEARTAVEFVAANGDAAFFERPDWRRSLDEVVARFRRGRPTTGDWESDEARRARVRDELGGSREILSERLRRDVTILSCPQGAMDDDVERLAVEEGYTLWTASSWRERGLNRPGGDSRRVFRCGRGYELFGAGRSHRLQVLSQRIVLQRFAGRRWARLATGAAGLAARILRNG